MTMGDRIAILNKGRLQQTDTSYNVFQRPANQFVAGVIGSPPANFFDCTLNRETAILDAGAFRYPLTDELVKAQRKQPQTK
jgi:multiple sugar transport system ATP-binding protein